LNSKIKQPGRLHQILETIPVEDGYILVFGFVASLSYAVVSIRLKRYIFENKKHFFKMKFKAPF
jgi:hypothetical protein